MIVRLENRSTGLKFYCQSNFTIPVFGSVGSVSPTLSSGQAYNFNFQDTTTINVLLLRIVSGSTTLKFDNAPISKASIVYTLFGSSANPMILINPYTTIR